MIPYRPKTLYKAVRWSGTNIEEVNSLQISTILSRENNTLLVSCGHRVLQWILCQVGDWIVKDVNDCCELYGPEEFSRLFEISF